MIDLRTGDYLRLVRDISDESVDLVFLDPPFNVGKKYGNNHDDKRTDYYEWLESCISESFRVLKNTGTIYLMSITRHLGKLYPMMDTRGVFINHVTWRNVSGALSPRCFGNESQPILVYGKTEKYTFNRYAQVRDLSKSRLRWGKYSTEPKGQMFDYWDDIPFVYAGSVHHPEAILISGTNKKVHPAQMPIALIERAILFSTNEGDLVMEPFGGLSAGAIASINTGRNYISYEQNEYFVRVAMERVEKRIAALKRSVGESSPQKLSDTITQMDIFA